VSYAFLSYADEQTVSALTVAAREVIAAAPAQRFPAAPDHHIQIRPAPEV
jgi:hypothetical protein